MNAITDIRHHHEAELLRFTTAGSVDDGKSTLIGRLLYDTKAIYEDQVAAVRRSTERRGGSGVDLALFTDGLIAEREQGITIDVAYRYFSTPRRKFIIADTPGHEQYTRNMATGASTANLAVVLVDARRGVLVQARRHACIASLLGIPHLVVAVNKMDLVGWSQEVFEAIRDDFTPFLARLDFHDVQFVPISALEGDMVVERGQSMPWHQGATLLALLEGVTIAGDVNRHDFRFPVQYVCRPQEADRHDFRGYMGRIESGSVKVGDAVAVLPSGRVTRVREIHVGGRAVPSAGVPQSVTLLVEDQLDISRGDTLVHAPGQHQGGSAAHEEGAPRVAREFEATLVWMGDAPLDPRRRYIVKHGTRLTRALIGAPHFRVDVNTLEREPAAGLGMNDIGHVTLKTQQPLVFDRYRENRATGAFIVIDESNHHTVAAGMIQ